MSRTRTNVYVIAPLPPKTRARRARPLPSVGMLWSSNPYLEVIQLAGKAKGSRGKDKSSDSSRGRTAKKPDAKSVELASEGKSSKKGSKSKKTSRGK